MDGQHSGLGVQPAVVQPVHVRRDLCGGRRQRQRRRDPGYPASVFEQAFGKPSARYRVDGWYVLVYQTNLLRKLGPVLP